ncbi:hypothetical protein PTW37_03305 [Arthrobacter agilis]|uniref:hypothetical protein n=1 Tax=Arthrobacter agilis TaxID=37921 RepID=UPI002365DC39|nr:hypothetical protein [Arthrobacter agilis]WDF33966.1 hypothetical protein PTW37_03305 [Arthrobacter agilis]
MRTTRDLLVVAQLIRAVARSVPGVPIVRVSGDGWVLAGRTGSSTICSMVEELWVGLLDAVAHRPGTAEDLASEVEKRLDGSPTSPLEERVLTDGLRILRAEQ